MIQNPRVGALRYFLVLPIVMYFIYFIMIDGQNYQISEKPDGITWGGLSEPPTINKKTVDFRYCTDYTGTETNLFPEKCVVYDVQDIYHDETNGAFITTARTTQVQSYDCDDTQMQDGTCANPWTTSSEETTYVTNVESYQLSLNSYAQATRHLRQTDKEDLYAAVSYTTSGKLVDQNGNTILEFPGNWLRDTITVGHLLQAAGVTLDDQCEGTFCPISTSSKRGTGMVLFVTVEYDNLANLEVSPTYEIRVRAVPHSVYKKVNVVYDNTDKNRIVHELAGLRIIFLSSGLIGRFDFPLMLTYAASTLFFFFIISYLVDFLLLCAMPNRRIYHNLIYEEPVNPDAVEGKVKQIKSHKMYRVLDTNDATAIATHLVRCENANLIRPGKPQLLPLAREMEHDVNLNRAAAEEVLLGMLTCETDPAKQALTLADIDYLFRSVDKDQNRVLTHNEVMQAFQNIGVYADPRRILKIMRAYDPQEEPVMTKENFQSLMQGAPIGFEARLRITMDQFIREDFWSSKVEQRNLDGDFQKLQRENPDMTLVKREQFQVYLRQERKFDLTPQQFDALWIVADRDKKGGINAEEFTYWTRFMDIYTFTLSQAKARASKEEAAKLSKSRSAVSVNAGSGSSTAPASSPAPGPTGPGFGMGGNMVTKNQLNAINWATAKSQFRQIATHVNALHEKYIELARITRLLQLKYLPHTITDGQPEDFEPITLEGDWRGEKAAECQLN